ncbi:MAG: FtsX-like permease family protein [Salinivirgaceae bacterium]|nr:FtsX-like permease family protein [Salinivirgaceae bacterium]
MNLLAFIARRYFFSRKSHNIINIISGISMAGVVVCTAALVIILSVYNGFDDLIKSMFSTFDPDIKITAAQGKTFNPNTDSLKAITNLSYVELACPTLEENVLLEYEKHIHPATIKGVPLNFAELTGIDSTITRGTFTLHDGHKPMAVVGTGLAYYLSLNINFLSSIKIYVPKRSGSISSLNPENAFSKAYIFPSGVFNIQQEIDNKYMLVPIDFARNLLEYSHSQQVSAIEIKLRSGTNVAKAQDEIEQLAGPNYVVRNQYQQHEMLYKVMKSEKMAIYLILTFILIVSSFNMIGSISMLIIDKKNDIGTLNNLGMSKKDVQRIFMLEGWIISIGGALIGLIIGAAICWGQQTFGWLKLDSMGTFVISNYPVKMMASDFVLSLITVLGIGLFASWYPIKLFTKKYLGESK